MPIEIERRFLVCSDEWRATPAPSRRYLQGYLSRTPESSVRVRRSEDGATITVKGPRDGFARPEFEYRIPLLHADFMLRSLCVTPIIEKVRHWVEHAGLTWEVDVYCGAASGLVLAEVELKRIDQPFAIPPWVGADVTQDLAYRSAGIMQGLWRGKRVRTRSPVARRAGARPVLASSEVRPGQAVIVSLMTEGFPRPRNRAAARRRRARRGAPRPGVRWPSSDSASCASAKTR